jgi:hypothetical protein
MITERPNWKAHAALTFTYVTALASVFAAKEKVLEDGGYRIAGSLTGHPEQLGNLWRLHFFASDIFLLMALLPILFLLVNRIAGFTVYSRAILLVSLMLTVLSFVNLNALGATGKFFSIDQIGPMVTWVRERPSSILEYVSISALLKFAVLLGLIVVSYRVRNAPIFETLKAVPMMALAIFFLLTATAFYALFADRHPRTVFHSAVVVQMVKSFFVVEDVGDEVGGPAIAAADLRYACSNTNRSTQSDGAHAKRNVVLFIMETVPYELYVAGKAHGLPTFSAMEKSALVASNHFTTYPFTSYARFSIFTGLYPSYRIEKSLPLNYRHAYNSEFSRMVSDGYDFQVFDPVVNRYPVDDWVIHQLGGRVVSTTSTGDVEAKDQSVLDSLRAAIDSSAQSHRPFVYAYLPQITHGPWLSGLPNKESLYDEGIRRLEKLDRSLASVVSSLKKSGVYDNTIILITADHGLRTRKEADFISTTVMNRVAYQVPLIIHDPTLQRTIPLTSISSHVDISPTLHCLYSADKPDIETQGVVLAPGPMAPRQVFFGGEWYNGSGGVWKTNAFYSFNRQLDMVWKSPRFDFDETHPSEDATMHGAISKLLTKQNKMQEQLLGTH